MRLRALLTLVVFLAGLGVARADTNSTAAGFVTTLVGEAVATIRDQQLSDAVREQRLESLLTRGLDIPRVARYVLGRHWRDASDAERTEFAALFQQWLVRTSASRLAHYAGETVQVTGARDDGDGAVVASAIIHPSGPPTKIEWRLAGHDGDYKITDITVEGVSLALTEREEIAATISRDGGTVAAVNRMLKQKLAPQATADAHQ